VFSAGLAGFRENLKIPPPKGKASGSNPEGRAIHQRSVALFCHSGGMAFGRKRLNTDAQLGCDRSQIYMIIKAVLSLC